LTDVQRREHPTSLPTQASRAKTFPLSTLLDMQESRIVLSNPLAPGGTSDGGLSPETKRLMALLGHTNSKGELRKEGRDKIAQVLAFLPVMKKVVKHTSKRKPMTVLECASGKGHLSLVLNQILTETIDRNINWVGIDSSSRLISKCRLVARQMGFANVEYRMSRILDYVENRPVDAVLALHACDTATDEALVKGLEIGARHILLVPCCHREISSQLAHVSHPALEALIGNYTHRKIVGSLITDAMRRLALESFGYKVDIFEYVSVRKTEKNVMIRAELGALPDPRSWELYKAALAELGVDLTLDRLLAQRGLRPDFTTPHGEDASPPRARGSSRRPG
jgi:hypothetical protein